MVGFAAAVANNMLSSLRLCLRLALAFLHTGKLLSLVLCVPVLFDRVADLFHHFIIKIQIMQDAQTHSQHFLRLEQVTDVCSGIGTACRALAAFLDRTRIKLVLLI